MYVTATMIWSEIDSCRYCGVKEAYSTSTADDHGDDNNDDEKIMTIIMMKQG